MMSEASLTTPRRNGTANDAGTPAAEVDITHELVRALIETQFPMYADLDIAPASVGWDNVTYRLGEQLAVRLPRRDVAVALIVKEQRWLPSLDLPVPTPIPQGTGKPAEGYPWPWSIVPWLPGDTANHATLNASGIRRLTTALQALHRPAPRGAPTNTVRGVPLIERAYTLEPRLARLRDRLPGAVLAIWDDALAAPLCRDETWIHGDFHARNVLVANGDLVGIIDWGDMARGDPATDLAAFWLWVPDSNARRAAMRQLNHDSDTWRRARGWAFLLSIVLLDSGLVDNPEHAEMGWTGLRLLERAPDIA